jgi:hypothetical protein
MTLRRTVMLAATAALIVSGTVLGLLGWLGIWQYMLFGSTDLRVILWPSSVMLPMEWCTTARGILITVLSAIVNCFLYIGIALMLRTFISAVRRSA